MVAAASFTNVSITNACVTNISGQTASFTNVSVAGQLYAQTGWFYNVYSGYSDERVKIKKANLSNCLSKISSLSTFEYYPNASLFNEYGIPFVNKPDIGLSAQELLPLFPDLVCPAPCDTIYNSESNTETSRTGLNLLTVKYDRLIPVLIRAIQELKDEVDVLKSKNN